MGSNIGEWSQFILKVAPDAGLKIHLFEPSAKTFNKMLAKSWPQNVFLNNFGLGQNNEKLTLNIFEDESAINSLYARKGIEGYDIVKTEKVQIRVLDDYCAERGIEQVDFMKVDVEGHELPVLQGASKMLASRKISMIQFEYGGCNLDSRIYLRDIWEFLQSHGYELAKIFPDRTERVKKYDQRLENFKYSNWIGYIE